MHTHRNTFTLRQSPIVIPLLIIFCVLASCVHPVDRKTDPSGKSMERLKILTYNTLHGLEPSGLTVKPGESKETRQARLDLQFEELSKVQPDVMLLQEVNPLPDMAKAYVAGLKRFGLQYAQVHQVDACGVRLAPGLAVVPGLNNGLAVLAKTPLKVKKIEGLKLSGGLGRCGDYAGFQTGELRYALIAEVENPDNGRKLLAVSLHLHSGIERNAYFIQKLNEAVEQGRARREAIEPIVTAMEQDLKRRLDEIRTLAKELQRLQAEGSYLGALVGGDFNFEPGDPEYRELEQIGLRDTYTIASRDSDVYSLDPQRNVLAERGERDVPAELREAIKRLPESEQRRVLEGYRTGVTQARRVDFLFLMKHPSHDLKGCLRQELFGQPSTDSGPAGSDHFGVLDTYITDASEC
jgi:endonuclease/exonuclease/phosphatase family metal-dependent hydrolase